MSPHFIPYPLKGRNKQLCFRKTVLTKSTANSSCFISISNIAHAKYKLSQALLLNYEKSP